MFWFRTWGLDTKNNIENIENLMVKHWVMVTGIVSIVSKNSIAYKRGQEIVLLRNLLS